MISQLEGFLEQRLHEMKLESDALSGSFFQSAPTVLQIANQKSISDMLNKVKDLIGQMQTDKVKLLGLMKDNPK